MPHHLLYFVISQLQLIRVCKVGTGCFRDGYLMSQLSSSERFLNLFTDVKSGEGTTAIILFANVLQQVSVVCGTGYYVD